MAVKVTVPPGITVASVGTIVITGDSTAIDVRINE